MGSTRPRVPYMIPGVPVTRTDHHGLGTTRRLDVILIGSSGDLWMRSSVDVRGEQWYYPCPSDYLTTSTSTRFP